MAIIYYLSSFLTTKNNTLITVLFSLLFSFKSYSTISFYNDTIPTPKAITAIKKVFTKKRKDSIRVAKTEKRDTIKQILKESVKPNYWKLTHKPGLLLTQTSFLNWTKGGNNTIAGIISFKGDYNYKKGQLFWKNAVLFKYGISKENGSEYSQKTDDVIDLKSSIGYKTEIESKWYYSGEFNLTTQFGKGYKGNDRTTVISNFFAPARMRLGVGAVYTDEDDNFKFHLSPLTNQVTFVLDQKLADKGAFGVEPAVKNDQGEIIKAGQNINSEFGTLIRIEYKTPIMKNINFGLKSSFYSDYLNKFGNVDSDIEINIDMKVNQFISSSISSHLLYDDDAKILQTDGTLLGPKLQLKQILGVGVTYAF
ncbi:hypothetical protein FHR24_000543 [Wenyingzhuangia heitensis]|uniref:DUF3078 domain-containing protein n=1 Tax=Wenyingzhuangia heitensis TaxID=1487859 RepID=A0ABX0U5H5_9FLAO|nr:DUF3078 domain-containing protein [Wenyingzhuangia heitensis]NIJ44104.1 hypothetical protein [Wenyingzhuangia heitensis]